MNASNQIQDLTQKNDAEESRNVKQNKKETMPLGGHGGP